MKTSTIQTFKSPRWVALYVSLGMMLLGYVGATVFNRPYHHDGPKGPLGGGFDVLCLGSVLFGVIGGFIGAISALWILIAAVISLSRHKS